MPFTPTCVAADPSSTDSRNDTAVVVSRAASEREWDAFVMAQPDATGYHLWRWRNIFERAFGHETRYLIAHRADEVMGILPLVLFRSWLFGRFAVSLPFVNYGGVVATDADAARALVASRSNRSRAPTVPC